jgi:hypothetical protein
MNDIVPVYKQLRGILAPYAKDLVVKKDNDTHFYIDAKYI